MKMFFKGGKLRYCIRHNLMVNKALSLNKGKINTKFFLRAIYELCEMNDRLLDTIIKDHELSGKPIMINYETKIKEVKA